MTTNDERERSRSAPPEIDWLEVAKAALSSAVVAGVVGGALHVLKKAFEYEVDEAGEKHSAERNADAPLDDADVREVDVTAIEADQSARDAASVLGVQPDASEDEIRAALRARLADSNVHPDHGGDAEESKRFIAAKNLLIERMRAARTGASE